MTQKENLAFGALSDRVRRQILAVLTDGGEVTVTEIAESVGTVGRTTISSHLRILRTSGVVIERRDGRRRLYSIDTDGAVRDAFVFLQRILEQGVRTSDVQSGRYGSSQHEFVRSRSVG